MSPELTEIRLGLVGLGRWGRVLRDNISALPGVRLAAIATGGTVPAPDGCTVFRHWSDMLAAGGLDGVVIATPPASHAEIALAAIGRKVPVLVEKPLTLDPAEALAVGNAARAALVPVRVDHIHLYAPAFRKLAELAAGLGPILSIHGKAGNRGPYRTDTSVLWDWGAHDAAMAVALLGGPPGRAEATRLERRQISEGMGETVRLRLEFGAVVAESLLSTLTDKCRRLDVTCEGGVLVYDDLAEAKLTLNGETVDIGAERPLAVVLNEFAQAIRLGNCSFRDLDVGIAVVQALDLAARSLET